MFFVVALKEDRGSPKRQWSTPARVFKDLFKVVPKNVNPENMCCTRRNCLLSTNRGLVFSKNGTRLEHQVHFINPASPVHSNLGQLEREARHDGESAGMSSPVWFVLDMSRSEYICVDMNRSE